MDYVGYKLYSQRPRLYFFSCVHYGDPQGHDADLWKDLLTEIHQTPNALVFGLGDYLDFTRTTYRPPIVAAWGEDDKTRAQVDEAILKTYVDPFVAQVKKYCPSYREKFLGFIEGNHLWRFGWGKTTTERICEDLGIRYLGLSAWVRLTIARSREKHRLCAYHNLNILLNHSVSGAGNLPSSLSHAHKKLAGWRGVDVFVTANDHQLGHDTIQQPGCTQRGTPRQMMYETVIGKAGSFQKGYNPGACSASYVEKSFLHPSRLGWLAFDAWIYTKSPSGTERHHAPEVWRYGNFSV